MRDECMAFTITQIDMRMVTPTRPDRTHEYQSSRTNNTWTENSVGKEEQEEEEPHETFTLRTTS